MWMDERMYECMNGWMDGWMDGCDGWNPLIIHGKSLIWLNEWMNERTNEWMNKWMDGWMRTFFIHGKSLTTNNKVMFFFWLIFGNAAWYPYITIFICMDERMNEWWMEICMEVWNPLSIHDKYFPKQSYGFGEATGVCSSSVNHYPSVMTETERK